MNALVKEALACVQENQLERGLRVLEQALNEYPDDKDVLYCAGLILFQAGSYAQALDAFVASYIHPLQDPEEKRQILRLILEAYYEPNKENFRRRYVKNVRHLAVYERNFIREFPDFENLRFLPVPRTEEEFYVFDKLNASFGAKVCLRPAVVPRGGISALDCLMMADTYRVAELKSIGEEVTKGYTFYGSRIPVYLVWKREVMEVYLQLEDYEEIIKSRQFLFWGEAGSEAELAAFLRDDQAPLPRKFIGEIPPHLLRVVRAAAAFRLEEFKRSRSAVGQLASGYNREFYCRLLRRPRELRILFIVRRYCAPRLGESIYADDNCLFDCMTACQEIGITCDLYGPKSDIHWISYKGALLKKIAAFKPHVVFEVNRHKWEWGVIPDEFMQIVWVLDPPEALPKIYSPALAGKVRWNDFFIAMTPKFREGLIGSGYPAKQVIYQPLPVNTTLFDRQELTGAERARYEAEITYVSNVGNLQGYLRRVVASLVEGRSNPEEIRLIEAFVRAICTAIEKKIISGEPLFTLPHYKEILRKEAENYGISFNPGKISELAFVAGMRVGNFCHRLVPLKWLAERGYALKLWGDEWHRNEEFRQFAGGALAHKDVPKALSGAKITLGLQHQTTMHPRALEAMACGSLYLCKYIPPAHDLDPIQNHFTAGEDFVFFYDRDDLLRKIDYFLRHEEERLRIAESGRRKVRERFNHRCIMEKILSHVAGEISR